MISQDGGAYTELFPRLGNSTQHGYFDAIIIDYNTDVRAGSRMIQRSQCCLPPGHTYQFKAQFRVVGGVNGFTIEGWVLTVEHAVM